jgi:iron complex outermembrane recepter protein
MKCALCLKSIGKCFLILSLGSQVGICGAASESVDNSDLTQLSLEELTKVQISSVARKDKELYKTAAAVYVITREDIRNSAVSSIPELFRIVPGMQVAQVYANEWAVSARGFNSGFADKMLVLIDGRSIYSEIYSGVFWGQNDLLLEDIERIEVIRGPGGTLWGANAVNGIINIITSKAKQAQGTEVVAEASRMDREAAIRYGGAVGKQIHYSGYFKYLKRNQLLADDGADANDAAKEQTGGVRIDWQAKTSDWFTLHGNLFRGREDKRLATDLSSGSGSWIDNNVKTSNGYALTRWEHRFDNSNLALQASFTQDIHEELTGQGRERSLDFDFQHQLPAFWHNDINWGMGYRLTTDRIGGNPVPFSHSHHRDALYSFFFEDDYSLVPNKLVLTAGFKLQHNSYSGYEVQPSARILWTANAHHSAWAAASRSVRTPSVQDRDLNLTEQQAPVNSMPTEIIVSGNPSFDSEVLRSYEAGYRQQVGKNVSVDLAGFLNFYSGLRNRLRGEPYVVLSQEEPTLIIPIVYDNGLGAHTRGIETAISWTPTHALRIQCSYSLMNAHVHIADGQADILGDTWSSPTNTLSLRGNWALARHWTLYSSLYSVSKLNSASSTVTYPVNRYERFDMHISYNALKSLQFSAGGDNLQQDRHPEFDPSDGYSVRSQIPRSGFVKLVWSF